MKSFKDNLDLITEQKEEDIEAYFLLTVLEDSQYVCSYDSKNSYKLLAYLELFLFEIKSSLLKNMSDEDDVEIDDLNEDFFKIGPKKDDSIN